MKRRNFLRQYVRDTRAVGAIAPSSRFLARKMMQSIDFGAARHIVQLGAGTGVFTAEIIERMDVASRLIIIEVNTEFCVHLHDRFAHDSRVTIVNDSAEKLKSILAQHSIPRADYIVSGLPFTSLPLAVSQRILDTSVDALKSEGIFVTFQYTKLKMKLFEQYFSRITTQFEPRNIPPAFVLTCHNKE